MQTSTSTPVVYPAPKQYDGSGDMQLVLIIFAVVLIPLAFLPRYWTQKRIDEANR